MNGETGTVNTMRILVIEDEYKTATYLKKGLSENGYTVDLSSDGVEGLRLAREGEYDLIILDVMLPGLDGWSVLSELKKVNSDATVMFLTARDSIEDRVKGLELQADDYLVKPFAFSELLARVKNVLRRGAKRMPDTLKISDLQLDLFRRKALRAGKSLNLTPKEFALLSLLARRAGEVLSRAVIAEQVWDINFDADTNVIDVAVRRLRAKVDDPFDQKLIHTMRGMGYVLEAR